MKYRDDVKVIYKDDNIIIHLDTFFKQITVHKVVDGKESTPNGYVVGSNCLLYAEYKE